MKRPTLLAPEPAREAPQAPSMPLPASIDRRVVRADRARLRRAARERRRAEAAEVRRFTRAVRRRRIVALSAALFLVVSVATPVLLAVSPAFAVRTITVAGGGGALTAEVRRALSPEVGVPLALVDGKDVAGRIGRVAGVARFSVARIPPGTLAVRVVPRTPIAQVRTGGAYRLVDAAGVVLGTSTDRFAARPLVTAAPGTAGFAAAAAVLRSLPGTLAARERGVAAPTPDDVPLTLADVRLVVWGSHDDGA
ncbi:MAG: cell division protein FtsQ/DivIB, partial [Amnibacterium sp.]